MNWPKGVGMKRNNGVAMHVASTPGAIGYVDLLHAKAGNISYGTVKNRYGKFIYATPDNITAAAEELGKNIKEDLTFKLTDMPGEK
jgi:phosphate transport system substrate-binding protein